MKHLLAAVLLLLALSNVAIADDWMIRSGDNLTLLAPSNGKMTLGTSNEYAVDICADQADTPSCLSLSGTGALTIPNGATVTTGGATITAGGLTVTAGGATVAAGAVNLGAAQLEVSNGTTLPAAPVAGDIFLDTNDGACDDADDSGGTVVCLYNGSAWIVLGNTGT